MELVSPAGRGEKLAYAWEYERKPPTFGLFRFSLRLLSRENLAPTIGKRSQPPEAAYAAQGPPKRLFCAVQRGVS
jgi:hypothetical protein